jgi:hypothetical protein
MDIHQKKNMPYNIDALTDMNRFHHLQQWRSSFGIRKMSKIGIAFLLMTPCLFAQGDEKRKDEKHEGNSGVRHEEAKPDSGPIVDNYKIAEPDEASRKLPDGRKEWQFIYGTANVTVNSDGSWNFSGRMNQYGDFEKNEKKSQELTLGTNASFNLVFALKSSEGTVIAF